MMNFKEKDKVIFKTGIDKGKIGVIRGSYRNNLLDENVYTVFIPHKVGEFSYSFGTTYSNVQGYRLISVSSKTSICIIPFWAVEIGVCFRFRNNWWVKTDAFKARDALLMKTNAKIERDDLVAIKELDLVNCGPYFLANYLYSKFEA